MPRPSHRGDDSLLAQTVAVNAPGWAIRDPLASTRPRSVVINCYYPTTLSVKSALSATDKAVIERQSLELTDRELRDVGGPGTRKYLVVGYAYPSAIKAAEFLSCGRLKSRTPVGTQNNPGRSVQLPDGKLPWLVVTELIAEKTEEAKYYVLFHPQNGLCKPFIIAQKFAFYFHEFRNWATGVHTKRVEWNDAVKEQSMRMDAVQSYKESNDDEDEESLWLTTSAEGDEEAESELEDDLISTNFSNVVDKDTESQTEEIEGRREAEEARVHILLREF